MNNAQLRGLRFMAETLKEGKIMAEKNECAKTRKVDNPYEVWSANDWTWKVLKKYQTPSKEAANPYARWYCCVTSPFTMGDGDFGDVYVRDIKGSAIKIQ